MIRKIIITIGSGVILLVGSGCAVINPTNPYDSAAAGLTRSHTPAAVMQNHSKNVKEEKVSAHFSLTLGDAVKMALENNPQVAAAKHEIDAAAARHSQALAKALPSITAMGGYTHDKDDQRLLPSHYNGEPGVYGDDIYSADIVLTQPLFAGGRLIKEISATKLLTRAATHRLSRTKKELVFNVTSTFYAILAQKKVVDSLKFSKKAIEEHLKQVNNLIAQKKAARVDRLRTEVRLADIIQELTRAQNVLSVQKRVLANLMGLADIGGKFDVKGDLVSEQRLSLDLQSSFAKAFEHRSDYLAARAALEAAANEVDVARAGHWPVVSLQGTYGMRWADDPSVYPPGTDKSEDLGRIGVYVNLPIFESGRITAKVREQRAALAAAREKLRALELAIRLDVETAALNIETAQKRINTTEKAILQSKETFRIEREKYDQGKGSITDVLDAQSAMLVSQTNYFKALADFNTAIAQMRLATGEMK